MAIPVRRRPYPGATEQGRIARSPTRSKDDRRQRDEAERQLDILRASSDAQRQADFYTYRYFASEGFLPGYSFPRLPLSAFIPGRGRRGRDEGEYLQRPRFLAISEFGPQTYLYHEGARYRINRVMLDPEMDGSGKPTGGGLITQNVKRCSGCGYMHLIDEPLGAAWTNLLQMRNVSTVRRDRITSDEEERYRVGYEVISGVEFASRSGRSDVIRRRLLGRVGSTGAISEPLFDISYASTATLWRLNLGWRRRKEKTQRGFVIDVERGYWGKRDDSDDPDDPM